MKKIVLLALIGFTFYCCEKTFTPPPPPSTPVSRTMLIYMSANNDLSGYAYSNISNIKSAVEKGALNGGRILILWRRIGTSSATDLVEISLDKAGKAQEKILKPYGPNINASDAAMLRMAIADMMEYAPAENYCLDLWSHALGWLPAVKQRVTGFSFGDDAGRRMDITDMADAIDKDIFDFILFDCCLMGGIETLYQIRNKTPYVIASPTEIIGEGMPYDKIVPIIFKTAAPNLKDVCQAYITEQPDYGVISLYDMSKIEAVAEAFADIAAKSSVDIAETNTSGVQYFFETYTVSPDYWAFDMLNLSEKLSENTTALDTAISSMILFHKYASAPFNITINRSCGVSMSFPLKRYDDANLSWSDFYKTLDWYNRTYKK